MTVNARLQIDHTHHEGYDLGINGGNIMTGQELLIYGALILGVGGNLVFFAMYLRDKFKASKA